MTIFEECNHCERYNDPTQQPICYQCSQAPGWELPLHYKSKKDKDMVNSPPHYTTGKFEVIDIIEDTLKEGFEDYLYGNMIKYIMRYRHKNGLEDLKKARWHLDRLIKKYEQHKI